MVVLAALRRKAMKSKQSHTSHNCALTLEFVYQQQALTKHVQVYKRVLQANICRAKKNIRIPNEDTNAKARKSDV